jgi:hypothetical protein
MNVPFVIMQDFASREYKNQSVIEFIVFFDDQTSCSGHIFLVWQ